MNRINGTSSAIEYKMSALSKLEDCLVPTATEAPKDKGKVVYLIQFLYGFAMLVPFNVILSSLDFF